METVVLWFALSKAATPPAPPVYVPICIPGHPKCDRPYPPGTPASVKRAVGRAIAGRLR